MKKIFYRPKLEAGVNATGWQPCSTYTGSLIRQTHDEIILEVNDIVSGATSQIMSEVTSLSGTVVSNTEQIGQLVVTAQAISGSVSSVEDRVTTLSGEINSISGDVRSVSGTVESHTEQIGQLSVTAQAISGSVSDVSDRVTTLTGEVNTISGDVRSVSGTVETHTTQIGQLTITTQAISGSVSSVQDSIVDITTNIGELSGITDDLDSAISGITDDISTINRDIDDINTVIDSLSAETSTLSGITQDINELSGTVRSHTEQIGQLTVTTQAISGSVVSVNDRVTTLSNQQQTLSATTEEHTAKIGQLTVTTEAISGSVSSVSDRLTTVSDNVNQISATVSGHTQQIGSLTVSTEAISGNVSSINSQITTISDDLHDTNITVSGHTEQIGALTVTTQAISGSVSSVSDQVTQVQNNLEGTNSVVSGHTEQIGALTVTTQAISGSVSSVSDHVTQVQNNLDGTNNIVSGHTEQIGALQLQASGFTVSIAELQNNSVNANYLPINGWKKLGTGEFIEPTDEMMYSGGSATTIESPKVYLDAGDYIVSSYNPGGDLNHTFFTIISSQSGPIEASSAYTVSSDSYMGCTRKVQTFHISTPGNHLFRYGNSQVTDTYLYRPKLEKGNILTAYTQQQVQYSSLIDQTSQQITLEVTEQISENDAVAQFKRTGIDITNGKVEIDAENTYINGNLELRAQDDADALTLMDDNDVERATITSQEIGALSGQSMSTTQTWDYSGLLDYGDSTVITLGTKAFTANSVVTSGQQYGLGRVGYAILTYKDDNNQWQPQYIDNPNSCTIGIKLVNTSNPTIQYILPSQQVTYSGSEGRYWLESRRMSSGSNKVVITTSGTYNIIATITWANNTQTSPFARQTKYQIWAYMQVDAVTKTLVGADGMYSTNGMNNYMHFSKDGFHACDTSDSNNIIISSCGAAVSDKINPGGGQPIRTVDKWLDNGQKYTGPAHISDFKSGGPHWNLSQSYANVVSINRTNGWYTESNPCVPLPSTDIILVENFFDDNSVVWIDMAPMEYHGHIVTIRNFEHPLDTNLKSSNGTRFHWYKQSGPSYTNQFEFGWDTKFPASFEYTWTAGSRWHTSTWVYEDITGSSSYGSENGRWIMLNISTYTYNG